MRFNDIRKMSRTANYVSDQIDATKNRKWIRYGLCSKCKNFQVIETELFDHEAWCNCFDDGRRVKYIRPRMVDPIDSCSLFEDKGTMSLVMMGQIAYLIDVKPVKRKAGFDLEKEEMEVTVRNPEEVEKEGDLAPESESLGWE
jgi:hypothetical protein